MKTLLRVKTIVLTAIFCLFLSASATAKNYNKELKGVWKLVLPIEMQEQTKNVVFYKVFNKDKTYINYSSTDSGVTFAITSRGTYLADIEGIYVEDLAPLFAAKYKVYSNAITYKIDEKIMTITFKMNGKVYSEKWMQISK